MQALLPSRWHTVLQYAHKHNSKIQCSSGGLCATCVCMCAIVSVVTSTISASRWQCIQYTHPERAPILTDTHFAERGCRSLRQHSLRSAAADGYMVRPFNALARSAKFVISITRSSWRYEFILRMKKESLILCVKPAPYTYPCAADTNSSTQYWWNHLKRRFDFSNQCNSRIQWILESIICLASYFFHIQ